MSYTRRIINFIRREGKHQAAEGRSRFRRENGFTLIELLIVVAIIAILAAIAVPNFLEAQVRAKITRVAADMRTIATGLEAYVVDHNVYPVADVAWTYGPRAQRSLTTPVAFLTALPEDPFNLDGFHWNGYSAESDKLRLFAYMAYKEDYPVAKFFAFDYTRWTGKEWTLGMGWQLRSLGPVLTDQSSIPYDSTNGTKSDGDISRFNTGIEH